jgi:hypothetical protein
VEYKTTKEVCDTLLPTYKHNSSGNLYELQKQLFQAKILPGRSLMEYIASLNMVVSQLRNMLVS